ncbi:MAG: hypothetical protein IPM82_16385 [Saprospiraceae bacterium]|nr:hypothetical protein [Saprospiraceae bacterium]
MPVTTDSVPSPRCSFLRIANPDMAGTQGSAIGESISIARRALQELGKDSH